MESTMYAINELCQRNSMQSGWTMQIDPKHCQEVLEGLNSQEKLDKQ